jgi:hypothetical protein
VFAYFVYPDATLQLAFLTPCTSLVNAMAGEDTELVLVPIKNVGVWQKNIPHGINLY